MVLDDNKRIYRNRLEIVKDILSVMKNDSCKKTHIMYGANLSYQMLTQYLKELSDTGLVKCHKSSYMITQKGKMFLQVYNDYERICRQIDKRLNHSLCKRKTLEIMLAAELNKGAFGAT